MWHPRPGMSDVVLSPFSGRPLEEREAPETRRLRQRVCELEEVLELKIKQTEELKAKCEKLEKMVKTLRSKPENSIKLSFLMPTLTSDASFVGTQWQFPHHVSKNELIVESRRQTTVRMTPTIAGKVDKRLANLRFELTLVYATTHAEVDMTKLDGLGDYPFSTGYSIVAQAGADGVVRFTAFVLAQSRKAKNSCFKFRATCLTDAIHVEPAYSAAFRVLHRKYVKQ